VGRGFESRRGHFLKVLWEKHLQRVLIKSLGECLTTVRHLSPNVAFARFHRIQGLRHRTFGQVVELQRLDSPDVDSRAIFDPKLKSFWQYVQANPSQG
jgi:hypothetical protein